LYFLSYVYNGELYSYPMIGSTSHITILNCLSYHTASAVVEESCNWCSVIVLADGLSFAANLCPAIWYECTQDKQRTV